MHPVRRGLPEAIHQALRMWHTVPPSTSPWREMITVAEHSAAFPTARPERAVRPLLLETLGSLAEQSGKDTAQVLQLRFLEGLTAAETARRMNLTEDVVYKRQRAALEQLADLLWEAELEARTAKELRIAGRLQIKSPPRLFGVDDKQAELVRVILHEGPPWLIGLVGIGGIGKTSLADAVVRDVVTSPAFSDIAWISAHQERLAGWDREPGGEDETPALSFESWLDTVVEQFGFQDLSRLALGPKRDALRARLKARRYLAVVDNLEQRADYQALLPAFHEFVNPGKVVFTSRRSLHGYPGVYNLLLDELSEADSLALVRHEAAERGLADVASAPDTSLLPVFEVVGGNPLALRLLVGQMHTLSLTRVVDDLRRASGRKVDDLYRFIYWRSWQLLSEPARRVLAIMPLVAESGGRLRQIAALGELAEDESAAALEELTTLCLVNVQGTIETRRYSIHRLTETFLLSQVLRWQDLS